MANLRQEIAIGSTGDELVAAFTTNAKNANIRVFNVEDYGAVHNNSTDDTAAIQAAINACHAAGGGVVFFPIGIYAISGALQNNVGDDLIDYNSQLYIPYLGTSTTTKIVIHLLGEICPSFSQGVGISTTGKAPINGSILKSTIVGSGTNPSVLSCGASSGGDYLDNNRNDTIVENLQFQFVPNSSTQLTMGALNFFRGRNAIVRNVCCYPYDTGLGSIGVPQNNCVGIIMPQINCEHICILENCSVGGFETGYKLGEHTSLKDTIANTCLYGYEFAANYHIVHATRIASYWCGSDLRFTGVAYVKINGLQVEWRDEGDWFDSVNTILDASNYGHGEVYYSIVEAMVGFNNSRFSKSGGANLQCFPVAFAAASSFTVSGARNNPEAALKSLITALAAKGIIVDSTTET